MGLRGHGNAQGLLGVLCVAIALAWSSASKAETRVYLLRGWFGVFSTGLDTLAAELRSKGIKAETVGHLAWKTTVSNIIKWHASADSGAVQTCRSSSWGVSCQRPPPPPFASIRTGEPGRCCSPHPSSMFWARPASSRCAIIFEECRPSSS